MWTKKKTRYELYTGNFTGVIVASDYRELRFFWAIYYTKFLHPVDNQKPPPVEDQMLTSSNYEYSLQDAKRAVQERILEYKITDGVGKAQYKQMAV